MRIELAQSTKTEVPDQPQPVVQEMNLTQGFDISALKELENGGRQLELKFESESMDVSQGGQSVLSFDSLQSPALDANNPVAPVLRAMIGARIQYFTDANGKVERMDGRGRIDEARCHDRTAADTGDVPANVQRGHAEAVRFLRRFPAGPRGQSWRQLAVQGRCVQSPSAF